MYQKTEFFQCDATGLGTGPIDDDNCDYPEAGDAERDPLRIPAGWLEIRLRIKIPNPELAEALAERAQQVEAQITAVIQANSNGAQPNPQEMEVIRDAIERQIPLPEIPDFVVNEALLHYSHDHVYAALFAQIGEGGVPGAGFGDICEDLGLPDPRQQLQQQVQQQAPQPVQQQPVPAPQPVQQPVPVQQVSQASQAQTFPGLPGLPGNPTGASPVMAPLGGGGPAALPQQPQAQQQVPQAQPARDPFAPAQQQQQVTQQQPAQGFPNLASLLGSGNGR